MMLSDVPLRLTHLWRQRGDCVVVYSDAHFNLVRLEFNGVGSRVWELMDGHRTAEEIVQQIQHEHPAVERSRIIEDVQVFFEQLREEWLALTTEEMATYE